MSELFDVVSASMNSDLNRLNATAHNLSNVSTTGFKRVMPNKPYYFDEVMQQANLHNEQSIASLIVDKRQGALSYTGSYFDLAIEGDAYFELATATGESQLSRGGSFTLDGRGRLLSTQSGLPLMSESGEIYLQPGTFQVKDNGQVIQNDQIIAQIKLVYPEANAQIESLGNGLYRLASGALSHEKKGVRLRQHFQEASNVNSAQEMLALIETTRHFESMQKVVHGVDTMYEKVLRTIGEF